MKNPETNRPLDGVLLTNLGTPDAPDAAATRRYLREFLWDPRIVSLPRGLWWLILHGIILRTRPARSARAYQRVWTDEGSPLLVISRKQHACIQGILSQDYPQVPVVLGMRYGNPSIPVALEELRLAGVRRLLVLPLYPQYSSATTASTYDAVGKALSAWPEPPELHKTTHYYDQSWYIDALAASIRQAWETQGGARFLLFSFHGMPDRTRLAGDPYYEQCQQTVRRVVTALQLSEGEWQLAFQSRFGREQWLQPYTDETLRTLARSGISDVNVICPGFSSDCLETLEEINMLNRDLFLSAGGKTFEYIPALNDSSLHIEGLVGMIKAALSGV